MIEFAEMIINILLYTGHLILMGVTGVIIVIMCWYALYYSFIGLKHVATYIRNIDKEV